MQLTAELLERLDVPGPRYTSYPTAPVWNESFDAARLQERLHGADARSELPLAIYCHIPYCASMCWYCGCNVIITPRRERGSEYVDLLLKEAQLWAAQIPNRRSVGQHHWGGGTPTFLPPAELVRLFQGLDALFPATPGAEISLEVDPRVTTVEQLAALRDCGFNRVSMGVQDFSPDVQRAIHREQSEEQTGALIAAAKRLGYTSVNVDLVYGLPLQTEAGLEHSIRSVIEMGADRAACYSFAYVPWLKKHQSLIAAESLPRGAAKYRLLERAIAAFRAGGFVLIGMDHFAKATDDLAIAAEEGQLHRNFMGYTTQPGDDMLALGITAIGEVDGAFTQNHKTLHPWRTAIEQGTLPVHRGWRRSADDELRRRVILDLMCRFRVDFGDYAETLARPFAEHFAAEITALDRWQQQGLVQIDADGLQVTELGRLFIRNLCMPFDAYLPEQQRQSTPMFSRTV